MPRPRETMPEDVRKALHQGGLLAAYEARPPYQRNDWLIWIKTAKRPETRQKRLQSMLAELEAGHGYMGMPWQPRGKGRPD